MRLEAKTEWQPTRYQQRNTQDLNSGSATAWCEVDPVEATADVDQPKPRESRGTGAQLARRRGEPPIRAPSVALDTDLSARRGGYGEHGLSGLAISNCSMVSTPATSVLCFQSRSIDHGSGRNARWGHAARCLAERETRLNAGTGQVN
jgi:hypothetical protein